VKLLRVGAQGQPDHPCLRPGDRAKVEIDGIGRVEQSFVAAS
jgi:2-keto-4-pentenoate hydratase/2-oxohepta-3-ene-1,7-dioic acid hydratase in catechol pathway